MLRLRGHVLALAKRKRKETGRAAQPALKIRPGTGNLTLQSALIAGTAIKMSPRMAAKLNASPAPVLDLVPGEGKKSSGARCQIMVELLMRFDGLSGHEHDDWYSGLLRHSPQGNEVVTVPVVKGQYHGRSAHAPGAQLPVSTR